jgi:hypothetical protein
MKETWRSVFVCLKVINAIVLKIQRYKRNYSVPLYKLISLDRSDSLIHDTKRHVILYYIHVFISYIYL